MPINLTVCPMCRAVVSPEAVLTCCPICREEGYDLCCFPAGVLTACLECETEAREDLA